MQAMIQVFFLLKLQPIHIYNLASVLEQIDQTTR
jgi:hypothetical protein